MTTESDTDKPPATRTYGVWCEWQTARQRTLEADGYVCRFCESDLAEDQTALAAEVERLRRQVEQLKKCQDRDAADVDRLFRHNGWSTERPW